MPGVLGYARLRGLLIVRRQESTMVVDITVRSLKFAILEALAAKPNHQHKFNLIGKGYYPGGLESSLGLQFDASQRHMAVTAFNELENAGLIRGTYTDQVNPEAWVEITDAGRDALRRRQLDALDAALDRIAGNLIEIRAGAWAAVSSRRPDSLRQAAHSARELIEQALKEGAPDEAVRSMRGFSQDATSRNGITRRHRLRYLMLASRGEASESDLKVAEQACELVLVTDDRLKALAHSRGMIATQDVRDALVAAEIALRRILLPEEPAV
jgi:DNA-binding PadR family transcriptional regulator